MASGKDIYNKVLPLIDYMGVVQKKESGQAVVYPDNYSPNNIKRLIISPDSAVVEYHVSVNGNKRKSVQYSAVTLSLCREMQDYMPAMSVLYADRICASVEEVIFFTKSTNSDIVLEYRDTDFQGLIKSYREGSSEDVLDLIRGRYKRLRYFTVIDDALTDSNRKKIMEVKTTELISDIFDTSRKIEVQDKDYLKHYGCAPKYYAMDKVGGTLNTFFNDLISKIENEEKADKLAEFKKKRLGAVESEFLTAFDTYEKCLKNYKKLKSMYNKLGTTHFSGVFPNMSVDFYSCPQLKEKQGVSLKEMKDEAKALKENTALCKRYVSSFYVSLLREIITSIQDMHMHNAILADVIVQDLNTYRFGLTPDLSSLIEEYNSQEGVLKIQLGKAGMERSLVNICVIFVRYFINSYGEHSVTKYKNEGGWK